VSSEKKVDVSELAVIHPSVKIWPGTSVRENAVIGEGTLIGRGVYIGPGVIIGSNCKIQNEAQIYEPAVISNGVFIGPGVIITNDKVPRAINIDSSIKGPEDWQKSQITIGEGASLGAGSIYVGKVTVGAWSMVGAGSVIVHDIKEFELVVGNPGRHVGWVGKAGFRLIYKSDKLWICPKTSTLYTINESN